MAWVYRSFQDGKHEVGFVEGEFFRSVFWCEEETEAEEWCHYLNGGTYEFQLDSIAATLGDIATNLNRIADQYEGKVKT